MEKSMLKFGHCEATVKKAMRSVDEAAKVDIDLGKQDGRRREHSRCSADHHLAGG
jgi:copper chaperone CopZ